MKETSGAINDLDAILVDGVNPFPAGTHDDTDSLIHFGGTWTAYSNANAHDSGSRYSETIGNTVSFHFTGTQLSLLYTGLTNRGTMQVYIDGSLVDTINQYSSTLTWQNRWDSAPVTPGLHTVQLVHASGQINDLDAILVDGVNPFPAGTHDDTDSRIHFGGTWTAYSNANAHDSGSRYSETIGNTVSFYFTGTQLSLLYTGLTNRGTMQVYIDGILIDTINQYSATLTWKKRWDGPALSPGQHKVRLVHASGSINDLDAVIVTDSTATVTPTATPTATITGTVTLPVTPGVTPIPTETPPPPLQSAEYFYDGDGNMVKAVVNDVVTYYPGRHYNQEVDNSVSTVKKFYTMGSTTIAVRTISGTEDVLNWVLGDHLGSASVTANEDGSWNSELKYTAFGEVRASSGLTPTEYRYTGQLEHSYIKLYWYRSRWYDPALSHFVQADTIVPFPNSTNSFDRYAYTHNNPIIYTDDSGHVIGAVAALGIAMGLGAIASYAIQVSENRTQGMDWGEALTTDISPEKIMGGALIAGGVVVGAAVAAVGLTAIGVTAGAACADGDCTNEVQAVSKTVAEGVDSIDDIITNKPINSGNVSVYRSVGIDGKSQYFGITNNFARRFYEHLRSPRHMYIEEIPGLRNLSRYDAKAVEQVLIRDRGLDNLLNKINSIATTNEIYTHAIQRGNEILDSIRYARNIPQ